MCWRRKIPCGKRYSCEGKCLLLDWEQQIPPDSGACRGCASSARAWWQHSAPSARGTKHELKLAPNPGLEQAQISRPEPELHARLSPKLSQSKAAG